MTICWSWLNSFHLCGNCKACSSSISSIIGSPPLTRELQDLDSDKSLRDRITPAHAGTTQLKNHNLLRLEDHPRSRGNYATNNTPPYRVPGSPPLTRELQQYILSPEVYARITPAHAGTTSILTIYVRHSDSTPIFKQTSKRTVTAKP